MPQAIVEVTKQWDEPFHVAVGTVVVAAGLLDTAVDAVIVLPHLEVPADPAFGDVALRLAARAGAAGRAIRVTRLCSVLGVPEQAVLVLEVTTPADAQGTHVKVKGRGATMALQVESIQVESANRYLPVGVGAVEIRGRSGVPRQTATGHV